MNILYYLGLSRFKKYGRIRRNIIQVVKMAIEETFKILEYEDVWPKVFISEGDIILKSGKRPFANYNSDKKILVKKL